MARVTDEALRAIVEVPSDFDTSSAIETASMIADEDLAGLGYTERRLGQIELYLAAHFCHISHAQIRSEEYGDTKVSYRGFDSQDLRSSSYGQTAINLDTSRKLDSLGKGTAYAEVL